MKAIFKLIIFVIIFLFQGLNVQAQTCPAVEKSAISPLNQTVDMPDLILEGYSLEANITNQTRVKKNFNFDNSRAKNSDFVFKNYFFKKTNPLLSFNKKQISPFIKNEILIRAP